jgi:hypothetical protein
MRRFKERLNDVRTTTARLKTFTKNETFVKSQSGRIANKNPSGDT